MRQAEAEGEHYYFLSPDEFARRIADGEFLEWAEYGGYRYGTLRAEIERGLASDRHVVLDIDVQGAEQLRAQFPNAVHVFILPPSAGTLTQRLRSRNTESDAMVRKRLDAASEELRHADRYDFVVVNDDLVEAVAQVAAILDLEARRPDRLLNLTSVVEQLRQDLAQSF